MYTFSTTSILFFLSQFIAFISEEAFVSFSFPTSVFTLHPLHLKAMSWLRMSWLLVACLGAIVNASGVLEVDLVFPLNETYAPTEHFPVVFAFQNPERAKHLNPYLSYTIWHWDTNFGDDVVVGIPELRWTNWSSHDPYLLHTYHGEFNTEGHWMLKWSLTWQSCDEYAFSVGSDTADMIRNSSTWSTTFTIKNSAPKVDLVAATANKSCPGEYSPGEYSGIAINVTDKTMGVPWRVNWSGSAYTNNTCAVVASQTLTPDPCRVSIDSAYTASMEASLRARQCNILLNPNPPDDCPEDDENTAQKLSVFGVSVLLTACGALGFFFM